MEATLTTRPRYWIFRSRPEWGQTVPDLPWLLLEKRPEAENSRNLGVHASHDEALAAMDVAAR